MWPIFLVLAAATALLGQESASFRYEVALVHVDTEVMVDHRSVDDLSAKDFVVSDNGKPVDVRYFSHDQTPLDVLLLLDVSGSMRQVIKRVADAARSAFAELRPEDRVGIMVFARRQKLITPLTTDRQEAEEGLTQALNARVGSGTLILAGVDAAAQYLLNQPRGERRRAVLIITDNEGTRSRRPGPVVRRLWEADAVLTGLVVSDPIARASRVTRYISPSAAAMHEGAGSVARQTGGEMEGVRDAGEAFGEALRRLRSRYSLYLGLPEGPPGEEHKIRVELSKQAQQANPGARARSRAGYIMPGPKNPAAR